MLALEGSAHAQACPGRSGPGLAGPWGHSEPVHWGESVHSPARRALDPVTARGWVRGCVDVPGARSQWLPCIRGRQLMAGARGLLRHRAAAGAGRSRPRPRSAPLPYPPQLGCWGEKWAGSRGQRYGQEGDAARGQWRGGWVAWGAVRGSLRGGPRGHGPHLLTGRDGDLEIQQPPRQGGARSGVTTSVGVWPLPRCG